MTQALALETAAWTETSDASRRPRLGASTSIIHVSICPFSVPYRTTITHPLPPCNKHAMCTNGSQIGVSAKLQDGWQPSYLDFRIKRVEFLCF